MELPEHHAQAPAILVEGGRPTFGSFAGAVGRANLIEMRRPGLGGRFPGLNLKQWQHYAVATPSLYVSLAVFDSRRVGLATAVVFDRASQRLVSWEERFVPGKVEFPQGLGRGRVLFERGSLRIEFRNRLDEGLHQISFRCRGDRLRPAVSGEVEVREGPQAQPLVVCLPLPPAGAMYSHKGVLPASGSIQVGPDVHRVEPADSYGLPDVHQGYYPREMAWRWATAGVVKDGTLLGFNLTDNQVEDQERYNENGLWVGDRLVRLPAVDFEHDRDQPMEPWRVRDRKRAGIVDLEFRPEVVRKIDLSLGPIRTRYRAPFGAFSGHILDGATQVDLDGAFGMTEDFYLRT